MVDVDEEFSDRVTIREVASRAGVSITTVSHTLNHPHRVSAETRDRVMRTIDDLQFVPKAAASIQARKRIGRIGVIAPFTSYASYLTRLTGVLDQAADAALDVIVFDHGSVAESINPMLSALPVTGRLDGLIVMGVPLDDVMANRLIKRKLPTVLVDSHHPQFSSVNVDDEQGGYLIGRYLIGRGHRSIAYAAETQASTDYDSSGQKRIRGLVRALAEEGLDESHLNWVVTSPDIAGGRAAAAELVGMDDPPTAVVGHDDIAAGVLGGFRAAGVDVPGTTAVVGYDGNPLSEAVDLTTMVQPLADTGRVALTMLRAAIDDPDAVTQHLMLTCQLRQGATS